MGHPSSEQPSLAGAGDHAPTTYSIVVPCFRSGKWLDDLVGRVGKVMKPLGEPFELILVNDASPDDTWPAIERNARSHSFVRGIDLLFNTGQFRALICGFEHARGRYVITMDDDLQHPPEELPKLITAMRERPELDCIMGAYEEKKHGLIRNLGSRFMGKLNEIFYQKPPALQMSSFRIMRRQVAEAVCAHKTIKPIIGPLILKSTRRIGNATVEHHPRAGGRSNYSLLKLIRTTLDNVISVSTLPLQILSIMGLLLALGSGLLILYYLLLYLVGHIAQVPGFTTVVLLVTFFGGVTLLSIGMLGEYVILIITQTSKPPRYFIRSEIGPDT
jgi:glycosyltransferase involved in cell wall biosynthesis